MKRPTETDPIKLAQRETNRGNQHRRSVRRYKEHWKCITEKHAEETFLKEHWGAAVRKMRRKFRNEFRGEEWKGLSIRWIGDGYSVDYRTVTVNAYLWYEAWWKGFQIERRCTPKDMDDVLAETWKLGGMLAGCCQRPECPANPDYVAKGARA